MSGTYDFIIVGGGISGSVVASRLAHSSKAPKVLLIEAGGPNDSEDLRQPSGRFSVAFTQPTMTYPYSSTPQKQLKNQSVSYPRGRGLGGSSAINFSCWLLGHEEDYNRWAELVGDEAWQYDGPGGVKERFRKIENVRDDIDESLEKYISRDALKGHSKEGKVNICYEKNWSELDKLTLEAGIKFGGPLNTDINSGDPTGFGMSATTFHNGLRVTAATAYLTSPPCNLTILTESPVAKILFNESKRAAGVQIIGGEIYHASQEVIVSAGGIDSPKILLLSGIGPRDELAQFSIPVVHDQPAMGKHLIDHAYVTTTLLRKERTLPADHDIHGTTGMQVPMAWLSNPVVKTSKEFQDLDEDTKQHLLKVPSYEFMTTPVNLVQHQPDRPNAELMTFLIANMNALSEGSITLASADPTALPVIDLNYLSHPYDRRVFIEGLRQLMKFSEMPAFEAVTEKRVQGPEGDSDEELLDHCKTAISPVWHIAGTCRMGKDEESVVDKEFRVRGVEGLRVVDHSIAPLMTNNHTQTTAYLIGETAAEKLIVEYCL